MPTGRDYLNQYSHYFGLLETKEGLPRGTLSAVAMIESGGNPFAVGTSGERGAFQFMTGTGRQFGLRSFTGQDLRVNTAQSARAASELLGGLYRRWGDIDLAVAGYNAGEGALRRGRLPKSTQEHVRRFQAETGRTPTPAPTDFFGGLGTGGGSGSRESRSARGSQPQLGGGSGSANPDLDARGREKLEGLGMWWPGNWGSWIEAASAVFKTEAGATIMVLAGGVLALWIGVRNA